MNTDFRDSLLIYFADKSEAVISADIKESRFSLTIQNFIQDFDLSRMVMVHQVHGINGFIVDESIKDQATWSYVHADFIITNQKNVALLVLTADCIPLILYDSKNGIVAIVHAGWKGSFAGVLQQALLLMMHNFNASIDNMQCIFGPSARWCCYQVQADFIQQLYDARLLFFEKNYINNEHLFLRKKNDAYYFDNNFFLQEILKKFGIKEQNIYTNNALCTMCNSQFCSYRSGTNKEFRQISMVAMR